MIRERLNPPELFKSPGFSRIIRVEGSMRLIFIAGQTPTDIAYRCVGPGDLKRQYEQVIDNLTLQLTASGATWDDVVTRKIYTLQVDELLQLLRSGEITPPWKSGEPPTSTLLGVTRLSDPEFLIEIEIMAVTAA